MRDNHDGGGGSPAGATMPRIPVYFSHSYWDTDREVNRFFHDLFWDEGFAFAVDPRSGPLSTTHMEMMMRRSACFVGVVTRREEQPKYLCSPFAVYEYGLAVQAHKPRLLLLERGVPNWCFPDNDDRVIFDRRHLTDLVLDPRIRRLALEGRAYVNIGDRPIGDVGLLLPRTAQYRKVGPIIKEVLREAGYVPDEISLDSLDGAAAARIVDALDFVVVDIAVGGPTNGLVPFVHGRFVPSLKLVFHRPGDAHVDIPRLLRDDALETASAAREIAIWWSTPNQLEAELRKRIRRLHSPRHEFMSKVEGQAYFRSHGRERGPVFISNARADNELAREVVDLLGSYNITPFHYIHKNTLPVGEYWKPSLPEKVKESVVFAPLISAAYWESDWCRQEFETALAEYRTGYLRVVPFLLDDSSAPEVEVQGIYLGDKPPAVRAKRIVRCLDRDLLDRGERRRPPVVSSRVERQPVPDVDIAIVTVLPEEYEAMYAHLEEPERVPAERKVPNQYSWVTGWLTSSQQGRYRIVLALGKTGNERTALATRSMIDAFHPEYVLLVGVAGAIDSQLRQGDVVVADRICGYEYGKLDAGFIPRPDWSYPANQSVASAARTIATHQPGWADAIKIVAPAAATDTPPRVLVGQIASGNKVVDDLGEASFRAVLRQWPRLAAVEMEGLGGVLAVDDARDRGKSTGFSMIRGISDLPLQRSRRTRASGSGSRQTEQRELWKPRAAAAAAALTATLIQTGWPRPAQLSSMG